MTQFKDVNRQIGKDTKQAARSLPQGQPMPSGPTASATDGQNMSTRPPSPGPAVDTSSPMVDDLLGAGFHCEAAGMQQLLQKIATQIAEADRRQGDALQGMQTRLADLVERTQAAKDAAPSQSVAGIAVIEERIKELARSFEQLGRNNVPPQHLQRDEPAASGGELRARDPFHPGQVFSDRPTDSPQTPEHDEPKPPVMGYAAPQAVSMRVLEAKVAALAAKSTRDSSDLWDQDQAEALSQTYAEFQVMPSIDLMEPALFDEAHLGDEAHKSDALEPVEHAPPSFEPIQSSPPNRAPLHEPVAEQVRPAPEPAPDASAHGVGADRGWLESRFAEIASQLETSLSGMRPDGAMSMIGERFDVLENRLGAALGTLKNGIDPGALGQIEAQIAALKGQLDAMNARLGSLDSVQGLEQTLALVLEQAKEGRRDVAELSETVNHRLPMGSPSQSNADEHDQFGALRGLIEANVIERRAGENAAVSALSGIQTTLEQLAHRIKAVEQGVAQSALRSAARVEAARDTERYEPKQRMVAPEPVAPAAEPNSLPTMAADFFGKMRRSLPNHDRGQKRVNLKATSAVNRLAERQEAKRAPGVKSAQPSAEPVPHEGLLSAARRAAVNATRETIPGLDTIAPVNPVLVAENIKLTETSLAPDGAPERAKPGLFSAGTQGARRIHVALIVALLAASAGMVWGIFINKSDGPSVPAQVQKPKQPGNVGSLEPGDLPADLQGRSEAGPTILTQDTFKTDDRTLRAAPAGSELAGTQSPPTGTNGMTTGATNKAGSLERITAGILLDRGAPSISASDVNRLADAQRIAKISTELGSKAALRTAQDLNTPQAATQVALTPGQTVDDGVAQPVAQTIDVPPAQIGPSSLRSAAVKGDPSAEFEVATRFAQGRGVPKDLKKAADWYQRSASRGFAPSQYRLGGMYERGLGLQADQARARIWYRRAAEQGNIKAMHNLAVMYTQRTAAQQPDYPTAVQWFQQAADRGLADSQFNLGILYENGLGLPQNLPTAYKWLALAADRGDKEGAKHRDALEGRLDGAELAVQKAAVASWRPKPVDQMANDPVAAGQAWQNRGPDVGRSDPAQIPGQAPQAQSPSDSSARIKPQAAVDSSILDLSNATIETQVAEDERAGKASLGANQPVPPSTNETDTTNAVIPRTHKTLKVRNPADVERLLTQIGYDPSKLKGARPVPENGPAGAVDSGAAN